MFSDVYLQQWNVKSAETRRTANTPFYTARDTCKDVSSIPAEPTVYLTYCCSISSNRICAHLHDMVSRNVFTHHVSKIVC